MTNLVTPGDVLDMTGVSVYAAASPSRRPSSPP